MNIWTTKKRAEKLNYMHNNPVKRGLVLLFVITVTYCLSLCKNA